ncbi:MAG: UvrB/UvrC motif-containing protein, partial [Bacteroidota bacterium]
EKQIVYNKAHGIVPKTVLKSTDEIFKQTSVADAKYGDAELGSGAQYTMPDSRINMAADPVVAYMDKAGIEKMIVRTEKDMMKAARDMEFMEAARLRDELDALRNRLKELA